MKIMDKLRGAGPEQAGNYVADAPMMVGVIPLGGGMTIGFEQAGFQHYGVNLEIPGWEDNINLNRAQAVKTYTALEEWERWAEEIREDQPTLVYGSPPCQGVTGASRTSGADNPKNEWTLRFTDAALTMRPDFIVWENIPRMLSVGKSIVNRVDSMARDEGYSMSIHKHDVQGFGVSQKRKRVIFVLEKRGKERTWPSHTPKQAPTVWEAISDLDEIEPRDDMIEVHFDEEGNEHKGRAFRMFSYKGEPHNEWQAEMRSPEGFTTGHDFSPVDERFASVPQGRQWLAMPREEMTEKERSRIDDGRIFNAMEWMRLHPDRVGPTLTGARNRIHPYRQRLLSTREASRLMGFPDEWRWARPKEYQQFAAGVCPQVCRWYGDVIQSFVADRPLPAAEGRLF